MASLLSKILAFVVGMVALPFALVAALTAAIFGLKRKVSAREVAMDLRDFLEGSGDAYAWDHFTSVPIAEPRLDDIRRSALAVDLPVTEEGLNTVRLLLFEADQLAASESGA